MSSRLSGGRRRAISTYTAEEQALDRIARDAEERLAKKREARTAARNIRIRELERQQKESDHESDRRYDMLLDTSSTRNLPKSGSQIHLSRSTSNTGSVPSTGNPKEEKVPNGTHAPHPPPPPPVPPSANKSSTERSSTKQESSTKDTPGRLEQSEEKFRKAMLLLAQMDNEKSALLYEIDLLKDERDELNECFYQTSADSKSQTSEIKLLKRTLASLDEEMKMLKLQMQQRDALIEEAGLVLVEREKEEAGSSGSSSSSVPRDAPTHNKPKPFLFSQQVIALLEKVVPGDSTFDDKIKKIIDVSKHQKSRIQDLEMEVRTKPTRVEADRHQVNGPEFLDMHKDSDKQINDLKFKLQELERENTNLQGNIIRLESQVKRYKTSSDQNEKDIGTLKTANRDLKKALREKEMALDDQQDTNKHLQNRLEKLRLSRKGL